MLDCLCIDDYNPSKYNVTDKATQPNVIGYAVAAASDAINVYSILQLYKIRMLI